MWSFVGGMQVLVDALAGSLGPSIRLNSPVRKLEFVDGYWSVSGDGHSAISADAVVMAAPAHVQATLLGELDPVFATGLNAIPSNRIAVVALGYRKEDVPRKRDGFGYIAPQNTRRDVLGVQWCSSIFPNLRTRWVRALAGHLRRRPSRRSHRTRRRGAGSYRPGGNAGRHGRPRRAGLRPYHALARAIPQYVIGHRARVAKLEALAAKFDGLFLGGNAYHGIAVNDCTEQAELLVPRVRDSLTGRLS